MTRRIVDAVVLIIIAVATSGWLFTSWYAARRLRGLFRRRTPRQRALDAANRD